ncbi:recombinase family protein [Streptomyces sp. CHA1]|uniref:recombinase family protein n=1 Tax=Streptomyces TaxID=1883 RepID=UPI001BFC1249|nr:MULTISPECIES: recombinase family protein [unclassified Streptomyces]MBT3157386.1 recombinase family protein [Streptomyces sp. G11C]MCO6700289.1 recombinase family protein [Streptomyces sp. CHB9.2]MCO6706424.1 recombinase family protein [Streptomyces sp. CHA3]MCO6712167.1 recombinase family protein [Streptomyces sp. CHB19.2]MCO6718601.1 recombinase family protein [Streptomyces sp. Vc714c-19]
MTSAEAPATFHGPQAVQGGEPWLGYIRVSTWREEKISPELQKAAVLAWAARTGRQIIDWITDLDATGRNFKRKIMGAIQRVEEGEARGIAVWKFSRFGRTDLGIATNLARLEHAGGQLASATEDVDVRTAVGRFNRRILFDLAVFESDRAGEMWKDAHQWRRAHGLPATGGRRLGYVWYPRRIPDLTRLGEWVTQDERYEIDEGARADIEQLFERKLGLGAGTPEGYGSLAGWLNRLGHRTGVGTLWKADSLRRYMLSGFAAGLLRIHHPDCHCAYTDNGGTCTRWLLIDGAHDAIITPETWERYLAQVEERRSMSPRARNPTYPLTGLVRCGSCRGDAGATSAKRASGRIYGYAYTCGRQAHSGGTVCKDGVWVQRYLVEDAVMDWVRREAAASVDAAPPTPVEMNPDRDRQRAAGERARLQAEHTRIENALVNLAADRALNPSSYPGQVFEQAQGKLLAQLQAAKAGAEEAAAVESAPRREDFTPMAGKLLDLWDVLDAPEKNALLRQLIRRVVCTRGAKGKKGVEGSGETRVTVHAVWEPDPWADKATA